MNFAEFSQLSELSDEEFLAELANIRPYTARLLKKGPNFEPPGPDHTTGVTKIIWRHGKRNTALHRAGLLPIVCPVSDDSELAGLGIFSARPTRSTRSCPRTRRSRRTSSPTSSTPREALPAAPSPTSTSETETHRAKEP